MHILGKQQHLAASALLVLMLLGACWTDLRSRRIPNWLTMSGIVGGLVVRAWSGPGPLMDGALGIALALVFALPFFVTGVLGGGDAKLLMAVGAFMGPGDLALASLVIAMTGGVIALVEAGRRGVLLPTLVSCGSLLASWVTLGRRAFRRSPVAQERLTVPYGVAIAAGSLLWWFAGGLVS
jgi:prepilin peptidase CpaA